MIFIETERLVLRKLREEDFADFCAYAMDREMCRMIGRAQMDTVDAARANFDWLRDKEERGYGLVLKETGHVIGDLTVTAVQEDLKKLEALAGKQGRSMSFSISRNYQRRGLMSEALRAAITQLFKGEGMDYIQCGFFDFNAASRALQEKLGFTHLTTTEFEYGGERFVAEEQVLWKDDFKLLDMRGQG